MHRHVYKAIKDRVTAEVATLLHFEWDAGQWDSNGQHEGFKKPAVFIAFDQVEMQSIGKRVQMGTQPFTLTLVIDTAKSPREEDFLANESVAEQVRNALTGWRYEDANIILSNFRRVGQEPDSNPGSVSGLRWSYTVMVKDYGGEPTYTLNPNTPMEINGVTIPTSSDDVTALSIANPNTDPVAESDPISTILLSADAPCTFYAPNLPAGLTLTKTATNGAEITGTMGDATVSFSVVALGIGGGLDTGVVTLTKADAAGAIWTPDGQLGDDLIFFFDFSDPATYDVSPTEPNVIELIKDTRPSKSATIQAPYIDPEVDADKTKLIQWTYDPTMVAVQGDVQSAHQINGVPNQGEKWYLFSVCQGGGRAGLGFTTLAQPGGTETPQTWSFLDLTTSFRNYPWNQSLSTDAWVKAQRQGGLFMFEAYRVADLHPHTVKNDGTLYDLIHGGGNDYYQNGFEMVEAGRQLRLYFPYNTVVCLFAVKGTGLTAENIDKIRGWALHKFNLPKTDWDPGFVHYDDPPMAP